MSSVVLVSGTPGAGKSLFAVSRVHELAERESRQVFYFHIDGLVLPWTELGSIQEWVDVPDGSIVVVDEAHKAFPNRLASKGVPDWVEFVGELRHRGLSLWLVTQSPFSLDAFVRDRVTQHFYLQRKLGQERATVYENDGLLNTRSRGDLRVANKYLWKYPKQAYAWYKSAEVHTVKKALPKGSWWVGLVAVAAVWALYSFANMNVWSGVVGDVDKAVAVDGGQVSPSLFESAKKKDGVSAFVVGAQVPVVAGRPWTAEAYSHLVKAKTWPKPSCVRNEKTGVCRCYSQQVTLLAVDVGTCNALVEQGFFDPTKSDEFQGGDRVDSEAPGVLEGGPLSSSERSVYLAREVLRPSEWSALSLQPGGVARRYVVMERGSFDAL